MIVRSAKIRELVCRTLAGGVEAYSATIVLDESGETTMRLSREEHDDLALAMRAGARFTIGLRIAGPNLHALVTGERSTETNTDGGQR